MKAGNINIKFDDYSNKNLVPILEQVCKLIPSHFCRLESLHEVIIEGDRVSFVSYGYHTIKHDYVFKNEKLEELKK